MIVRQTATLEKPGANLASVNLGTSFHTPLRASIALNVPRHLPPVALILKI
jgi:hypothetical protein